MFKKVTIITLIALTIFCSNVQAQILVKSKLTQKYQLNSGSMSEGKIIIKNNSKKEIYIKVYKRDYDFDANGNNYYPKPGSKQRSNAVWINLTKKKYRIQPFEEKLIKYMIKVPESKNYSGTYWSMIMIEQDNIINDSNLNNLKQNIGFKQNIRYGIQIITNFPIKEKIKLEYKDVKINRKEKNTYEFELLVKNDNNYLIEGITKLILINRNNGKIINKYISKKRKLYPETSIKIRKNFNLKKNIPYKIIAITGNSKYGYHGRKYAVEVENN